MRKLRQFLLKKKQRICVNISLVDSVRSMDFDNPQAYDDTSILDGQVFIIIKYDGCLEDIDFMDFGTLQFIEKIF